MKIWEKLGRIWKSKRENEKQNKTTTKESGRFCHLANVNQDINLLRANFFTKILFAFKIVA